MRRMSHFLPIRLLLVFTLLFAQLGALTHGIAHTLAEQSQDQSLPHDKQCDLCAAYAQIGSAIGSSPSHFDFTAHPGSTFDTRLVSYRSTAFAAFAARAPPYSA